MIFERLFRSGPCAIVHKNLAQAAECISCTGRAVFAVPINTVGGNLSPQIFNVSVSAEARVVGKIPTDVIRVLVDHQLIASPVPVGDDVVIIRGDVPVVTAEPEAFAVSSPQDEYVLRSKTAAEVSVCPRLSQVVMRVVGAAIVSHPAVVFGVHVGHVRMALLVHSYVVLIRGPGLLSPRRGRCARRRGRSCRSGTASRNVSTTDRGMTATALRSAALRKSNHAN